MPDLKKAVSSILILFILGFAQDAKSQCPNVLDGVGLPSANPVWISCFGSDFNLFIQPVDTLFAYSIDWGDGSPLTTGDTLLPVSFEPHIYTAGTFNYTVTITANCGVIVGSVIMEISPSASIQIPLGVLAFGCAPATYSFINASTNVSPNTVFTWNWGDGSPIEVYGDSNLGDTLYHMYLPGTVGCDATVTLTASNNCPPLSTNIFFPLQVWEIDDARITADDTLLCYPDTIVHFDNTTILNCFGNGNTFQRYEYWNFGDYWGLGYDSIITWQPWSPPLRPGYDIAFPGLGTYTIMMVDSSFCGQDTAYSTITIIEQPIAGLSANPDTICTGESIIFSNLSIGANSYAWNFGDGSGWTSTGSGSQAHTFLISGTLTVFLVATITGGSSSCIDTASVVIEVLPSPQAIFSPSMASGCDSLDVTFTDGSISAVAWYWDFGNGDTSSSSTPPVISYSMPGIHIVQLTVTGSNGCQNSTTDTITIYETPVVNFTASSVCVNQVTNFTDSSTSGAQPIITWDWDFGDGNTDTVQNPSNTYVSAGPQNVVLTVATEFCSATDTVVIIADTLPIAAFNVDTAAGCSPATIVFSNVSTGAVSYAWDFGDSTTYSGLDTSHVFTNTGISDTIYTVTLIAITGSGCVDTTFLSISIHPAPISVFTSDAVPGCSPLQVSFTDTSIGVAQYYWDFGDGFADSTKNPTHAFVNTGAVDTIYSVRLVVRSDSLCFDTSYANIPVYAKPLAQFSVDTFQGCAPLSLNFNNTSIGAVSYAWDFGNGDTSDTAAASFPYTYINTSGVNMIDTVNLIVASVNGCLDTAMQPIEVLHSVFASFTQSDTASCGSLGVSFTNTSVDGSMSFWNFGDGSPLDLSLDPTHIFSNNDTLDSTYTIQLITQSSAGCTDTAYSEVKIFPSPISAFAASPMSQMFPDTTVNLLNLSSGGNWNYAWDFGDGIKDSVKNPGSHSYSTWNDYTIELIAYNSECSDTSNTVITILKPPPRAGFTVSDTVGCRPVTYTYNDTSLYADSLLWDFGDGTPFFYTSNSQSISHTYYNSGIFVVALRAFGFGGPPDVSFAVVEVLQRPVASFAINPNPAIVYLPDKPIYCLNLSTEAVQYKWDFGDGNTSDEVNPSHVYTALGNYDIELIAISAYGCVDTVVKDDVVAVEEGGEILFPNAFTPDPSGPGDGFYDPFSFDNDIFHPYWDGVKTYVLRIFNRWGELIFKTEDVSQGWDGYYRGELAQQDVYIWKATILFENGEQKTMAGDVTLLR